MSDKLKAYVVAPSDDFNDCGCALVFAENVNQAKVWAWREYWDVDCEYIYMRAWRRPKFDKYSNDKIGIMETNDDLPDGVVFYTEDF